MQLARPAYLYNPRAEARAARRFSSRTYIAVLLCVLVRAGAAVCVRYIMRDGGAGVTTTRALIKSDGPPVDARTIRRNSVKSLRRADSCLDINASVETFGSRSRTQNQSYYYDIILYVQLARGRLRQYLITARESERANHCTGWPSRLSLFSGAHLEGKPRGLDQPVYTALRFVMCERVAHEYYETRSLETFHGFDTSRRRDRMYNLSTRDTHLARGYY